MIGISDWFKHLWAAILLAPAVALAQAAAPATGTAIPYAAVHAALAPARAVEGNPRLMALKVIESKLGARPEQIRITIRARSGERVLVPRADGSMDFPLEDALLAENPVVTTNQPKGSLTMSVTLALKPPAGSRMALAEIEQALVDIEATLSKAGQGLAPGRIRGIEVRFAPGASASLTLRSEGERLFMADQAGRVVLMRDTDLAGQGDIEFSQRPALILPYLGR